MGGERDEGSMETISCRGNRGKLLHACAGNFNGDLAGGFRLDGVHCLGHFVYRDGRI